MNLLNQIKIEYMEKVKTRPLNNVDQFKIKPKATVALIPENELVIGGDAPVGSNNKKRVKEITELYNKFKKRKK